MRTPRRRLWSALLVVALAAGCSDGGGDEPDGNTLSSAPATAAASPTATPAPSASPSTMPLAGEMGIADRLTGMDATQRNAYLASMVARGVKWVRIDTDWRTIETSERRYDWSYYNPSLLAIKQHGLKSVIILGYASEWSSGRDSCARVICAPAATEAAVRAYANAAGATAEHYCGRLYDVRAIELWNEPNLGHYWPNPNPALYTRIMKAAYKRIKAECSHMTVLLGGQGDPRGNPGDKTSIKPVDFLTAVYRHGGKGSFDDVSAHPYVSGPPRNKPGEDGWGQMLAMRKVMERYGDGHKRIWVTEFAYDSRHIGPATQAKYLERAVSLFRSYPWAGPFFWYSFQDRGDRMFGLLDSRGRPKRSATVFGELAEQRRTRRK